MILAISCLFILVIFESYIYFNIQYLFSDTIIFFKKALFTINDKKLSDEEKLKFLKNYKQYIKILRLFIFITFNLFVFIFLTYVLLFFKYDIMLFFSPLNLIVSFVFSIIYYFIRKHYVKKL